MLMSTTSAKKQGSSPLEEKVRILEDKEAIRELKARYAYTLDAYDIESFLDLFVDDIIWESRKGKNVGKAALRDNVAKSFNIMPFFAHMYVAPVIKVLSDTEATGIWYMFEPETLVVNGEEKAVWVCAKYDEQYTKVNGEWKYKKVKADILFQTSFDRGWVKERTIL
jgi:hypothetical protein